MAKTATARTVGVQQLRRPPPVERRTPGGRRTAWLLCPLSLFATTPRFFVTTLSFASLATDLDTHADATQRQIAKLWADAEENTNRGKPVVKLAPKAPKERKPAKEPKPKATPISTTKPKASLRRP
ncbi:hypothetical protein K438DRAFT_1963114 [Mycena galopus ATCC 62051]|nr:hypothetical protein K438DRAFT_1963114 [Mycena galopus ATCC 62051]